MFLFVLVVGMVVINHDPNNFMLPVAIGSTLMILVYAGGHVSGGHYNPAVTLAVWLRGRCPTADVPAYWIAQLLGAILVTVVFKFVNPEGK
jgi:aquaporin Z